MIKDFIRSLLGTAAEHGAKKPSDPEDLIALSRTSLALETELGLKPLHEGALSFSNVDSASFDNALKEVEEVIEHDDSVDKTDVSVEQTKGTTWIRIKDRNIESLIVNLQYGASAMDSVDYDSRLLAAVLPLEIPSEQRIAYIIYSFRRGKFYPFVPLESKERDTNLELKIAQIIENEIELEPDRGYWYPLWPEEIDLYPWETK